MVKFSQYQETEDSDDAEKVSKYINWMPNTVFLLVHSMKEINDYRSSIQRSEQKDNSNIILIELITAFLNYK